VSIESAKAFIERVSTDEEFTNEVGEIATTAERMAFVKAAGFDFTMEDLETVSINSMLFDEELEAVAGVGICQRFGAYWLR